MNTTVCAYAGRKHEGGGGGGNSEEKATAAAGGVDSLGAAVGRTPADAAAGKKGREDESELDRERQRNEFLEARRRLKEEKRRASLKIQLQNNSPTPQRRRQQHRQEEEGDKSGQRREYQAWDRDRPCSYSCEKFDRESQIKHGSLSLWCNKH